MFPLDEHARTDNPMNAWQCYHPGRYELEPKSIGRCGDSDLDRRKWVQVPICILLSSWPIYSHVPVLSQLHSVRYLSMAHLPEHQTDAQTLDEMYSPLTQAVQGGNSICLVNI